MPNRRLDYLDAVRALLALWVVCNHAWLTIYPTVGGSTNPSGLLGLATTWMVYGHFAVVAFLVVSGYSLAIATAGNGNRLRGGFRVFLGRRFRRIVLPYWGALLISLALATTVISHDTGTHWDAALPVTAEGVLLHVTLLQDFATSGQINHAMWSIALEWHVYFLFPLILWLRRRLGLLTATGLVAAFGIVVSAQLNGGLSLWEETNLLGCFAVGVAAREIVTHSGEIALSARLSVRPPWQAVTAALVVGFLLLAHSMGTLAAAEQHNTLLEPLVGLIVACLLVALSRPRAGWARRPLSSAPLRAVGTYSYSIYLLHAPLLQIIWRYALEPLGLPLHDGWALGLLLALGLPLSCCVGWAYFQLVERRCLPRTLEPVGQQLVDRAVVEAHAGK